MAACPAFRLTSGFGLKRIWINIWPHKCVKKFFLPILTLLHGELLKTLNVKFLIFLSFFIIFKINSTKTYLSLDLTVYLLFWVNNVPKINAPPPPLPSPPPPPPSYIHPVINTLYEWKRPPPLAFWPKAFDKKPLTFWQTWDW